MEKEIITTANVTCPSCEHVQTAEMPIDACQHFFICQKCEENLNPKDGDCCIFCSYGDSKCPPRQRELPSNEQQQQNAQESADEND
ncbi:MAG: hypothetical protein OEX81_02865 [Candidatus Pacebacteria bacterium]|nr:hypothetical protein [Candidatus Paceibacterota bacterium]